MTSRMTTALGTLLLLGALLLFATLSSLATFGIDSTPPRLEFDEAYNLQIAESLRRGDGYSSFGALGTGKPWLFDPHITTGPVALLPVAGVWSVTNGSMTAVRAMLLVFLFAYAAGWWVLLREYRAGWLAEGIVVVTAIGAAAPGAGRVLGELPGAALLVWAGVAIARRRPLLAALAVGLAVQAKIVYGLAGTLMLAAWLFIAVTSDERPRLRLLFSMAALAAAPSLLFELYRLVSVGSLGMYLQSIREFQHFLANQKVQHWLDASILGAKMSGMLGAYPAHAWVALSAGALALICQGAFQARDGRVAKRSALPPPMATALAGLLAAGVAMLAGWMTQSLQTGVRQALPFFLLSVPAVVSLCLLLSVRFLRDTGAAPQSSVMLRSAVIAGAGLLSMSMILAIVVRLNEVAGSEYARASAREQKEVTELLRSVQPSSLYARGFWHNPEYQVLAGIRGVARRTGDRQLLIVQDYQVALSNTTWADHESKCGEVVRKNAFTLICWMAASANEELFKIIDWGPRSSPAGSVPLPQPGGKAAFWFKISPVLRDDLGPLRLHVGAHVSDAVLSPSADLVTGVVPESLFMNSGSHEVVLEQVTTERRLPVGTLLVE